MLGIVGGIAPSSTIEYYRRFIARYRERRGGDGYPHLVINSINLRTMLGMMEAHDRSGVIEFLGEEVRRLASAGATVGLFASNTPHLYFSEIQAASPIPLISIITAARDAVQARGFRTVGLLGTRYTMESRPYREEFAAAGIAIVAPSREDLELVHDRYMTELVPGIYRDETRDAFLAVIDRLTAAHRVDAVVLAGTELPILLPIPDHRGLPMLDTTQIHVDSAVEAVLTGD